MARHVKVLVPNPDLHLTTNHSSKTELPRNVEGMNGIGDKRVLCEVYYTHLQQVQFTVNNVNQCSSGILGITSFSILQLQFLPAQSGSTANTLDQMRHNFNKGSWTAV